MSAYSHPVARVLPEAGGGASGSAWPWLLSLSSTSSIRKTRPPARTALLRLRAAVAWRRVWLGRHAPANGLPMSCRLVAARRSGRRLEGEASLYGPVPAVGDRHHRDLSPRLSAVPAGRDRPSGDRQRADLDPDLRDRKSTRIVCRARLAACRGGDARLRVEDLQPAGRDVMTRAAQHTAARPRPFLGIRREPGRSRDGSHSG